ncbi:carboxylesterase/lipase family protein [Mucilaginibacter jinjuensis]|uniref:Carboxylic ester hydrolase n=1 Tax=Mucilaginibacter jinjuensis TaxID=1176721 RepID=A0ABY7T574_9SPHI|nr:carboxylesterase family protein [Mucilaginibacter jinjuensis]WCT11439.1 carboxylesterase family protein [Mucilaginibacter jinjuensis]
MKFTSPHFTRIAGLFLLIIATAASAQNIVVKTTKGYIKGIQENQSIIFRGVPYAQPPVAELRFKAPQPHFAWKDTLLCEKFGNTAVQGGDGGKVRGNEDCLSLNIYTPAIQPKTKMPVVVWVHGGSLTVGSGIGMNGHAFADRDSVIAVTINYRLGIFGFMYLGDVDKSLRTSGNNGLLDLMMALKWIKENINSFGGDPSRVTVMGESAGAKLTSTLLLTPQSKGLFSQLVLESGGVQCVRDSVTAKAIRQRVMNELHVSKASELLTLPAEQLMIAQAKVCKGAQGTNYFGPVDDGDIISGDPYQCIAKKTNKNIKLLIGTNKVESRLFMNMDKRLYTPDSTSLYDWFGNNYKYSLAAYQSEAKRIDPDSAAATVLTEYMYKMHSYRLADALAKAGNQLWIYRFDYNKDGKGATHADELPYVWYLPDAKHNDGFNTELAVQMHTAWVNFIKGDKPGKINYADWPPYQGVVRSIMVFDKISGPTTLKDVFNDPNHPSGSLVLN